MIVALAGRRVDAEDATTPRFPTANVGLVRDRLRALFRAHAANGLVASGACGADLIAHEVARELGMRRVMILPFPSPVFRERSVTDRPGDWGPLFDDLLADARVSGEVVELDLSVDKEQSNAAYLRANEVLLDRAGVRALAVVVWDGTSRGPDDVTAAFANQAKARGLTSVEILTTV